VSELLIREIMEILPHRYPLLLVDRILELEPGKRVVGYKNVTINESFFVGHFPGQPIMPGVYIIECMAQLAGTMILPTNDVTHPIPYLTGIDKAKFRRPVVPGDRLMVESTVERTRGNIGWVVATASVDGQVAASAQLMFSIASAERDFLDASVLHL